MAPNVSQGVKAVDSKATPAQIGSVSAKINAATGFYGVPNALFQAAVFNGRASTGKMQSAVSTAFRKDQEAGPRPGVDLFIDEPPILSDSSIPGLERGLARKAFNEKMASLSAAGRAGKLRYSPGTETVRIAKLQADYRAEVKKQYIAKYGTVPSSLDYLDADHPVDLVVGGKPDQALRLVHQSVNRSVGSQLKREAVAAGLKSGDPIRSISVR
jgi:hypothetical protein